MPTSGQTNAQKLRAPFPPELIGVLPKPYQKDSPKAKCPECNGYHGMPAAHLDYVGHAAVTDRLLQVDPEWSWEPFALDDVGLPAVDRGGNLWIRLTVAGTTRIGVGDGSSMKERIGDAIRNAAMRFGVALDLWSKEDLAGFAQATQEQEAREQAEQEEARREAERTPEERAEHAVERAQQARRNRDRGRRADPVSNARARAWDAVTERMGADTPQADRQAAIVDELQRREWPAPGSLSAEHWATIAEHYEEQTDDSIRQQHIVDGVEARSDHDA